MNADARPFGVCSGLVLTNFTTETPSLSTSKSTLNGPGRRCEDYFPQLERSLRIPRWKSRDQF